MQPEIIPDDSSFTEILRARCSQDLKSRVGAFCSKKGMSEATLIRLALLEFLERQAEGPGTKMLLLNQSTALSNPQPPSVVAEIASYGASKANKKRRRKPRPSPPALGGAARQKTPPRP